jgi:uncharacterized protein with ParB-like and HNH nuclease domain
MLANEVTIQDLPEFLEDEFDNETNSEELESEVQPIIDDSGKDRKLFTHPYDFIIRSLKDQVDDGTLVLADDFQRRRVWDDTKASRLIESLLINVPIPVCYFAELEDGSYSVIDGQQRLTAIYRYLNDKFKLRSLRIRSDLNKKKFSQLGISDRRSIQSRSIRCILIQKESHPEIRFDVFDRLNSNSVKLNRQELRNSLYKGDLNKLVKELSEDETFKKLRRSENVDKRMNDCEMILRFFAFYFDRPNYQGNLAKFLDNYLQSGMKMSSEVIHNHREIFLKTINDVDCVFGENSFRRYDPINDTWNKSLNRAIYDIVMLYFSAISSDIIQQKNNDILDEFKKIFNDEGFQEDITSFPEKIVRFQSRLDKWRTTLQGIGISVERIIIGMAHESI